MRTHDQVKALLMNDPEIKREYDALQPEFDIIRATISDSNGESRDS